MKIDIETYYEWEDDDGHARRSSKDDLEEIFGSKNWPEGVTPLYLVVAPSAYICECGMKDMAELIAAYLRTGGGQAKLDAVLVTRELTKN